MTSQKKRNKSDDNNNNNDDSSRLLLLLTDILGDLNITYESATNNDNNTLWTPKLVQESIKRSNIMSLLVKPLLNQLIQVHNDTTATAATATATTDNNTTETKPPLTIEITSWNDFFNKNSSSRSSDVINICPPWISKQDFIEKPYITKLEILCYLASTLQNYSLRRHQEDQQQDEQKNKSIHNNNKNNTTTNNKSDTAIIGKNDSSNGNVSSFTSSTSTSSSTSTTTTNIQEELSLPSHLTKEQQDIIQQCYYQLKLDYEKRRIGMKQRLDILLSNIMEAEKEDNEENDDDNDDKKISTEMKNKLQEQKILTFSSFNPSSIQMTKEELYQYFTTPHSSSSLSSNTTTDDKKNNQIVKFSSLPSPLENIGIVDRGGRPDDTAVRTTMPQWLSKS